MTPRLSYAPWNAEKVWNLQARQARQDLHPYTCNCSGDVVLLAAWDGWHCPKGCGYRQTWCLAIDAEHGGPPVADLLKGRYPVSKASSGMTGSPPVVTTDPTEVRLVLAVKEAVAKERARCATIAADIAWMMEMGGGELEPGERLRQVQRKIERGEEPLDVEGRLRREAS